MNAKSKKRLTCQSESKTNEGAKCCETDQKRGLMCLATQNGNNNLTTRGQRAAKRDQLRDQRENEARRQQILDDLEKTELSQRELESIKTENVLSTKIKTWMAEQQASDAVTGEIRRCLEENNFPDNFKAIKQNMARIFRTALIFSSKATLLTRREKRRQKMLIDLYRKGAAGQLDIVEGLVVEKENENQKTRIIVPDSAIYDIIFHVHNESHPGMRVTIAIIQKYFYVHCLREEVYEYVLHCKECQYGKGLKDPYENPYGRTVRQVERLTEFSMDLLHLPESFGYKYILAIQDVATGWLEAYPLKSATEQKIIDVMEKEFFPRYRARSIRSDKGPEFKGKKLLRVIKAHGCQLNFGISGYSQDKTVERALEEINRLIGVHLVKNNLANDKWVTLLPTILRQLRQAVDMSGSSPYEHTFGVNPHIPIVEYEEEISAPPDVGVTPQLDGNLLVSYGREERLLQPIPFEGGETFYAEVHNIQLEAENSQSKLDESRAQRHLATNRKRCKTYTPIIGELVDYHKAAQQEIMSRKTAIPWSGPFVVRQIRNRWRYILQEIDLEERKANGRVLEASIHQIRPTLHYTFEKRKEFQPFRREPRSDSSANCAAENVVLGHATNEWTKRRGARSAQKSRNEASCTSMEWGQSCPQE